MENHPRCNAGHFWAKSDQMAKVLGGSMAAVKFLTDKLVEADAISESQRDSVFHFHSAPARAARLLEVLESNCCKDMTLIEKLQRTLITHKNRMIEFRTLLEEMPKYSSTGACRTIGTFHEQWDYLTLARHKDEMIYELSQSMGATVSLTRELFHRQAISAQEFENCTKPRDASKRADMLVDLLVDRSYLDPSLIIKFQEALDSCKSNSTNLKRIARYLPEIKSPNKCVAETHEESSDYCSLRTLFQELLPKLSTTMAGVAKFVNELRVHHALTEEEFTKCSQGDALSRTKNAIETVLAKCDSDPGMVNKVFKSVSICKKKIRELKHMSTRIPPCYTNHKDCCRKFTNLEAWTNCTIEKHAREIIDELSQSMAAVTTLIKDLRITEALENEELDACLRPMNAFERAYTLIKILIRKIKEDPEIGAKFQESVVDCKFQHKTLARIAAKLDICVAESQVPCSAPGDQEEWSYEAVREFQPRLIEELGLSMPVVTLFVNRLRVNGVLTEKEVASILQSPVACQRAKMAVWMASDKIFDEQYMMAKYKWKCCSEEHSTMFCCNHRDGTSEDFDKSMLFTRTGDYVISKFQTSFLCCSKTYPFLKTLAEAMTEYSRANAKAGDFRISTKSIMRNDAAERQNLNCKLHVPQIMTHTN